MLNVGTEAFDPDALVGLIRRYGVSYAEGAVVVHEQDPTTELFFVVSGQVEFSVWDKQAGRRVLGRAGRGAVFGEVSCFGGAPRTATAVAVEDSMVLRFDRRTALQLVETSPRFALRIIQLLADRLRTATAVRPEPPPAEERRRIRRPLSIREALVV
jgi:NTE family protein